MNNYKVRMTFTRDTDGAYRCSGGALEALIDAAAAALDLITDPNADAGDPEVLYNVYPDIELRANRVTVDLARALLKFGHGAPQAVSHE